MLDTKYHKFGQLGDVKEKCETSQMLSWWK